MWEPTTKVKNTTSGEEQSYKVEFLAVFVSGTRMKRIIWSHALAVQPFLPEGNED
jgi:hypothetical protein